MIYNVDPQLSQWNVGRSIKVGDTNATHVLFACQGDSKGPKVEIVDGEAKIPDYLLQTGKTLIVYLMLDGVTLESKSFPVAKQPRPEDYVYEEDQRNYIYELITNAENATNEAITAAENAKRAIASATVATENANVATNNANLAADSANKAAIQAAHTAKSLMVVGNAKGAAIALDNAIDQFLVGCKIFGKTIPVDLVSVGDSGSITVNVTGKNLWDHSNDTVNMSDVSGWATTIWRNAAVAKTLRPNNTYTMKCTVTCLSVPNYASVYSDQCGFVLYQGVGKHIFMAVNIGKGVLKPGEKRVLQGTFTTPETIGGECVVMLYTQRFLQEDGKAVLASVRFDDVQIEIGGMATEYEPYKGQSITVSTPNGLGSVPGVAQDEINLTTGERIERTAVIDSYAGEVIPGAYISSTGELSNGATVRYVLNTPVVTPLSEEELAAYASLHTYKGNTTVFNDAGAYMELEYVTDAKKYIDSKISSAILQATVE